MKTFISTVFILNLIFMVNAAQINVTDDTVASSKYTYAVGDRLSNGIVGSIREIQTIVVPNGYKGNMQISCRDCTPTDKFDYDNDTLTNIESHIDTQFPALVRREVSLNGTNQNTIYSLYFQVDGDIPPFVFIFDDYGVVQSTEVTKGEMNTFIIVARKADETVSLSTDHEFIIDVYNNNGTFYSNQGLAVAEPAIFSTCTLYFEDTCKPDDSFTINGYTYPISSIYTSKFEEDMKEIFDTNMTIKADLYPYRVTLQFYDRLFDINTVNPSKIISNKAACSVTTSLTSGDHEIQSVIVVPSNPDSPGNFTIGVSDKSSSMILSGDATEEEVIEALESLSIKDIAVTKLEFGEGHIYVITFTKSTGKLDQLWVKPYNLEVQEITTYGARFGTFSLSINDSVIDNIDIGIGSEIFTKLLKESSAFEYVDVSLYERGPDNHIWSITYLTPINNNDFNYIWRVNCTNVTGIPVIGHDYVEITEQKSFVQSFDGLLTTSIVQFGFPYYIGSYNIPDIGDYLLNIKTNTQGGLIGEYYDSDDYSEGLKPVFTHIDSEINFDWSSGAITENRTDHVYIRWTGKIHVPHNAEYIFYITADDNFKLYINNTLLIENWGNIYEPNPNPSVEYNSSIYLYVNTYYDILIEYHEYTQFASIQLQWSSAFISKQIIPNIYYSFVEHIQGSPFSISLRPVPIANFVYTTVEGPGIEDNLAGVETYFIIHLKDQYNNYVSDDNINDRLDVYIYPCNGTDGMVYHLLPYYLSIGTYIVNYTIEDTGYYYLYIKLNDFNIYCGNSVYERCSPFRIEIKPGQLSPFTTETVVLHPQIYAGDYNEIILTARDVYGNLVYYGNDEFDVRFVNESKGYVHIETNFTQTKYNGSGIYIISFRPTFYGNYTVKIYSKDILINSSNNCIVSITPAVPYVENYQLKYHNYYAMENQLITIQTQDLYHNTRYCNDDDVDCLDMNIKEHLLLEIDNQLYSSYVYSLHFNITNDNSSLLSGSSNRMFRFKIDYNEIDINYAYDIHPLTLQHDLSANSDYEFKVYKIDEIYYITCINCTNKTTIEFKPLLEGDSEFIYQFEYINNASVTPYIVFPALVPYNHTFESFLYLSTDKTNNKTLNINFLLNQVISPTNIVEFYKDYHANTNNILTFNVSDLGLDDIYEIKIENKAMTDRTKPPTYQFTISCKDNKIECGYTISYYNYKSRYIYSYDSVEVIESKLSLIFGNVTVERSTTIDNINSKLQYEYVYTFHSLTGSINSAELKIDNTEIDIEYTQGVSDEGKDGFIYLTISGRESLPIYYESTAEEIQNKLSLIPGLELVNINISFGGVKNVFYDNHITGTIKYIYITLNELLHPFEVIKSDNDLSIEILSKRRLQHFMPGLLPK